MNSIIVACSGCGQKNRIPADRQHLGPKCGSCGNPIDLSRGAVPVELDDSSFASFISQATKPVMVDFFSPTCGPCQMLGPVIDNMARQFVGKVIIAKMDTSRNSTVPGQFRIRGVPTLIFFREGREEDRLVGALPEEALAQLQEMIEKP